MFALIFVCICTTLAELVKEESGILLTARQFRAAFPVDEYDNPLPTPEYIKYTEDLDRIHKQMARLEQQLRDAGMMNAYMVWADERYYEYCDEVYGTDADLYA